MVRNQANGSNVMGDYIQSIYNICYYEGSNNSKKSSAHANMANASGSAAKRSNQGSGSGMADSGGAGLKGIVNQTAYLVQNLNNPRGKTHAQASQENVSNFSVGHQGSGPIEGLPSNVHSQMPQSSQKSSHMSAASHASKISQKSSSHQKHRGSNLSKYPRLTLSNR